MRKLALLTMLTLVFAFLLLPTSTVNAQPNAGCRAGGTVYVGPYFGSWYATIRGSYTSLSFCGGTVAGLSEGDWAVQNYRNADTGDWRLYKIVFSTSDLSGSGAHCHWDMSLYPGGFHCPNGYGTGSLKLWTIQAEGTSGGPFELLGDATPSGFGFYAKP